MLYGVDVHDGYQRGLSFPLLARQGYSFACVKLTQGTGYVREQADEWVSMARDAGLIPGAYHWLTGADGAAQARWFHERIRLCGGPEGMLVQLDCEDDGYGPQMTAWATEWERLTGGHPFMIYSGSWWWPRTGDFNGAALTPYLWHSHYLAADADAIADDPAAFAARIPWSWWLPGYGGWKKATLLQFTSRGDAGGLGNNVDLNCTELTREQLLALTTPGGDVTAAEVWQTDDLVPAPTTRQDQANKFWTPAAVLHDADDAARLAATRTAELADRLLLIEAKLDLLLAQGGTGGATVAQVEELLNRTVAPFAVRPTDPGSGS